MEQSWFSIIISLIAVVFVFLFAIKKFSSQIEYIFGGKFKSLIEKVTSTPIKGLFVGLGMTSIIQSSSAVTVMLVSLADAGLIAFRNSLGVVIGSNIGTTLTTQLVAFKVLNIAPYILVLGFLLMSIKHKYNKIQHIGKPIFYFGLIFSCLFIISVLAGFFKDSEIVSFLIKHSSNIFISVLIGIVISTILQSSSIATSLVVIFASGGFLNLYQAFGIILGTNIGTTTTSLIASTVTDKNGKRVAVSHFIFNFVGVLIFLPFVRYFSILMSKIPVDLAGQVALSHLFFNIIIGLIFIIFINLFEKIVLRLVK